MRDELAQRLIAVLESIACALQDTPIRKPFDTKDNIPRNPSAPEDLESTDLSDWTIPPILPKTNVQVPPPDETYRGPGPK